jgi:poly-gamma-glutamate capsule biosynthesis protein CapA/YwtB (metallophosphatase superfamily)
LGYWHAASLFMSIMKLMRIALAGDVMIGRGVDQIMAQPADPELYESWARSAVRYVELAEEASGPLPRKVRPSYVWGDTLAHLDALDVDARVVNLETAITGRGIPWPDKGIHYRVHPVNADCLTAGGIDVVSLANNHMLDWSEPARDPCLARRRQRVSNGIRPRAPVRRLLTKDRTDVAMSTIRY